MSMSHIETLTKEYADSHEQLADEVDEMEHEIQEIKRRHMPTVKHLVRQASEAKDRLHHAIEQNPDLFDKPKTQVIAGVRVGLTKQRGKVQIDDESKVLERIHRLLPEDQAELLIRRREAVDKQACYQLTASDIKRLGIRVSDDCDKVVIKPTDSEVDKLVNKLLEDAGSEEDAWPESARTTTG